MKKTKEKIIPATFDPVFKALLTSEECREYLADIISYITKIPKEDIMNNLVVRNSELINNKVKEKRKITDLIVDVLNNRINLEMNKEYYTGLFTKNNAYQHKIAAEQFLSGKDYVEEKKIIQINFDLFTRYDKREVIKFMIMDVEKQIVETENYEKYHVNLDLISKKNYNKEKLSKEEKELLILTLEDIKEIEKLVEGDDTMKRVKDKVVELSEDEELIGVYDKEIVDRKVRNSMIKSAKMEAEKDGLEQGLKKGLKQGLEQGKIAGINEEKLNIAKKMLDEKIEIEIISKITNLSIDEIKNIKDIQN